MVGGVIRLFGSGCGWWVGLLGGGCGWLKER